VNTLSTTPLDPCKFNSLLCKSRTMKRFKRKLVRGSAVLTLGCWAIAQVLCAIHCTLGTGLDKAKLPCCHNLGSSTSDQEKGPPTPSHRGAGPSANCLALKTALLNDSRVEFARPSWDLAFCLPNIILRSNVTLSRSTAQVISQEKRREWALAHEFCTSPACRSLAPPQALI
jgi:hypothetical protein